MNEKNLITLFFFEMILMKFAYFFWYKTQVKEINKKKKNGNHNQWLVKIKTNIFTKNSSKLKFRRYKNKKWKIIENTWYNYEKQVNNIYKFFLKNPNNEKKGNTFVILFLTFYQTQTNKKNIYSHKYFFFYAYQTQTLQN